MSSSKSDSDVFFQLSLDLLCITDIKGIFIDANPSWEKLLGFTLVELRSKTMFDFLHPDDKATALVSLSKLNTDPSIQVVIDNRLRAKDGSYKWLSWHINRKDDKLYCSARDVTTHYQMKLEFEKLQSAGKIGSWSVDFQTMTSPWSDEVYRIHDMEVGAKVSVEDGINFYAPHDQPRIQFYVDECIANGTTFDDTFDFISAKGVQKRVRSIGTPIYDEDTVVGIYGTFQDVTEEYKKNKAMDEVVARMKLTVDSIDIGIWDWDVVNNVLVWDDKMYEVYGVRREDFVGAYEAWQSVLHKEDANVAEKEVQDALSGVKAFDTTFRICSPKAGIRWIRAKAVVFRDQEGNPTRMLGANYDITEAKNKDLEIQAQKNIAHHKQKLASLGEIAAGVGHEINNPLSVVVGHSSQLLSKAEAGTLELDKVKLAASKINDAAERISDIVKGLRTFAHSNEGELVDTDVVKLVQNIYGMYRQIYAKNEIQFDLKAPQEDIIAYVSPGRFQQVLVNLISNAKDAVKDCDKKRIVLSVRRDKNQLRVDVEDNGVGIPQETQPKVFDSFFTTKPVGEGAGIGLALSKSIALEFKGDLTFSTSHIGTTFTLSLPCRSKTDQKPSSQESQPQNISEEPSFNYKVLVVDDEEDVLEVIQDTLEDLSCRVFATTEATHALETLQSGEFDYVFTDLKMPKMSGADFIDQLKAMSLEKTPKIVAMSGGVSTDFEQMIHAKGLDGFLSKPFSSGAFIKLFKEDNS